MHKILIVFGTRPEAIKMSPLVLGLRKRLAEGAPIQYRVCVTGQHRGMLDQVLDIFEITPDYDLDIMRAGQQIAEATSRVLHGVTEVLCDYKPDVVLVQGDTTTAFAASLAAYYRKIRVGHIEAGLRTGDIYSPWPEEINRRLTGVIAGLHFPPTESAKQNLLREGVQENTICVTGNTVIDALQQVVLRLNDDTELSATIAAKFSHLNPAKRLVLVTAHRRESFGESLESICREVARLSERNDVEIMLPVHPNPVVRETVNRYLGDRRSIHLVDPLNYVEFVYLMSRACLLLTDSGGIQEEAPSLGKPVLVMRDVTERPEAVEAGTVRIVGTGEKIYAEAIKLLDDREEYARMSRAHNPYGDGKAADRIVQRLLDGAD